MILPTRTDVGRCLATALTRYSGHEPVVLAISPGGIKVAYEVAREFESPLDLLPAKALAVPGRSEAIFGAIAPGVVIVEERLVANLRLQESSLAGIIEFEKGELQRRARFLRDELPALTLKDRIVILVDDGRVMTVVARAAIRAAREGGAAHVAFASPRCSAAMMRVIRPLVDEFVVLCDPADRRVPPMCDEHFAQTTVDEIRRLIGQTRPSGPATKNGRSSRRRLEAAVPVESSQVPHPR